MMKSKLVRCYTYKDSEIEWIGEVPERWEATRLKYLCIYIKGYAFKSEDFIEAGTPVIKATDIKLYGITEPTNFIDPLNIENYKSVILKTGDFVLSTVGSQPHIVDSAVGQLARIDKKNSGKLLNQNTVILRIIGKCVENDFLYYNLMSKSFRNHLDVIAHGTANQASIKIYETLEYKVFLPSIPEQRAISDYLETKTAHIDRKIDLLVQKKVKYEELKQSLINETVTLGLDKTVAMKDSGVEWIGKVPEHWDVRRAKDLFDRKARPCFDDDKIVTVFRDGQVTLRLNRRVTGFTNAIKEHGYQQIKTGDLVIHAMDAFAGAIGVSDSTGKSSPVYLAYTAHDKETVYIPYYGKLLRQMALSGFISSLGKGIRERSTEFRHRQFAPLELVVPPLKEQKAIADYLDTKTAHIDRIVETINTQIDKLKELRKTLINDVVTGKIKVA